MGQNQNPVDSPRITPATILKRKKILWEAQSLIYQSEVSILGPVGCGPTTLPLRHSDANEEAGVTCST
jgi:hypothetical protein